MFAQLDDEGLLATARNDGWTSKDILAHLTTWEQRLLRWIARWRETGDPGRPEIGVTWENFDSLNLRDHAATKEQTVADMRKEASASYEALMNEVGAMSDDELAVRRDRRRPIMVVDHRSEHVRALQRAP